MSLNNLTPGNLLLLQCYMHAHTYNQCKIHTNFIDHLLYTKVTFCFQPWEKWSYHNWTCQTYVHFYALYLACFEMHAYYVRTYKFWKTIVRMYIHMYTQLKWSCVYMYVCVCAYIHMYVQHYSSVFITCSRTVQLNSNFKLACIKKYFLQITLHVHKSLSCMYCHVQVLDLRRVLLPDSWVSPSASWVILHAHPPQNFYQIFQHTYVRSS